MLTAMLALDNMRGAAHDLWEVNTDYEYHEHQRVAEPAVRPARRGARSRAFGRRWLTPQAEVT
jgi:hypothetical protein